MSNSFDAPVTAFGEEPGHGRALRNPLTVLFHVGFRTAALLFYIFCRWMTSSFVIAFLIILIFLSLDFWTVKNVTGRLLAGYRWWNVVDDEGRTSWRYEARKPGDMNPHSALEIRVFWAGLVVGPLLWGVFALVAFFTFSWSWLIIPILGTAMTGANLIGYLRCKWTSRQEMKSYLSKEWFGWILRRSVASATSDATQTPTQKQPA